MTTSDNMSGSVHDLFLSEAEVQYLTGIGRGRNGQSKEQIQYAQLLKMRVPFRVNARGLPIVTHAAVNGFKEENEADTKTEWRSNAK